MITIPIWSFVLLILGSALFLLTLGYEIYSFIQFSKTKD